MLSSVPASALFRPSFPLTACAGSRGEEAGPDAASPSWPRFQRLKARRRFRNPA
eukprot:CAMPEP_0170630596 /NCGR_PEP_ID=MMETSP0224-20130122/34103_1 /TAXON_ID=285029 /ORGANISM="Togula jolla, Strain CCCM 725" /LENGTH=53 /DNA_ID=CAMNT_0010958701 /DNA_START=107 /DNA_END=264 /DNA_ORIENTATION=-